jgi:DNA-binding MarR family transcriptional regulator
MKFHSTVAHLLSRVGTAHKSHVEKRLNEIGLHSGQVFMLIELWKRDGRRQVDLASELNLAPPTINKSLTGLIEGGFVTRDRVENDARSTRIFLTDHGKRVRDSVEAQWLEIEEEILTELTEAERLILSELLTKLKHFYFGTEPD